MILYDFILADGWCQTTAGAGQGPSKHLGNCLDKFGTCLFFFHILDNNWIITVIFFPYIVSMSDNIGYHHPNWLSYLSEGWLNPPTRKLVTPPQASWSGFRNASLALIAVANLWLDGREFRAAWGCIKTCQNHSTPMEKITCLGNEGPKHSWIFSVFLGVNATRVHGMYYRNIMKYHYTNSNSDNSNSKNMQEWYIK